MQQGNTAANWFLGRWPYRVLRTAMAAVFLVAGTVKLLSVGSFADVIYDFGLIPDPMVFPAAVVLAVTELAVGLALLIDLRGSLAVVTALLALFLSVVSYGLGIGLDIECGCFGPEDPIGVGSGLRGAVVHDAVLLGTCAFLYASRFWRSARPIRLMEFYDSIRNIKGGLPTWIRRKDGG